MVPGFEHHVAHDVGQHDAHALTSIVSIRVSPMHDVARRQDIEGNRREPAKPYDAMHPGDGGILSAINADWQDCGSGMLGHDCGAIIDLHECASYGDPPLRKDDRFLVLLDVVCERLDRKGLQGIHGENPRDAEGRLDPPLAGNLCIDCEGHLVREERPKQDRVKIGGVVGDDQDSVACLLVVLKSGDFHPEKQHEKPTKEFFDHGVKSR